MFLYSFLSNRCYRTISRSPNKTQSESPEGLHRFSFAVIKRATNNFSNLCVKVVDGEGYYEGYISENDYHGNVMVKRWKNGSIKLHKEMNLLSVCDHVNIISLVGYCDERRHGQFLVYEFIPNGTLYDYLHDDDKKRAFPLDVEQRLEIAIGVAQGLGYLHSHTLFHIAHGNLKPLQILLDDNLVPKISGFEFTLAGPVQSAYAAPEYHVHDYVLSCRADVYTFGVLMLELLCERSADVGRLVTLALPSLVKGELPKFAPEIVMMNITQECLRACGNLISDCLDVDPNKRPSMNQVVDELLLALKLQIQYQDVNCYRAVSRQVRPQNFQ